MQQTRKWMIRVKRLKPAVLDDTDYFEGTWNGVQRRAWLLAHRASYQVSGDHAEVWVSIEGLSSKSGDWVTVFQAKTRCSKDAKPR